MSHIFELVVFTASIKEYADKVIDYIDPNGLIKRRFYRDVSHNLTLVMHKVEWIVL